jgi:phosphate transport system substrate-binding protein
LQPVNKFATFLTAYKLAWLRLLFFSITFVFVACKSDNSTIKIKGSDTEVNLVADISESFYLANPKLFVSISGGGSGLGIASLINGTADLANSSRRINSQELEIFNKNNIRIDSFIFAQDAIAFVVSDQIDLDAISIENLKSILSGDYSNWQSIINVNRPINIYGRQSNSGTYSFIKKKLGIEFSPHSKQMNGNAQILESIRADNSGIGYVGAGYLMHGGTKGLKVLSVFSNSVEDAVSPLDNKKIEQGLYIFQRPLYQYFRVENYSKVKPFLDFEKTETGKKIIHSSGYYPVAL